MSAVRVEIAQVAAVRPDRLPTAARPGHPIRPGPATPLREHHVFNLYATIVSLYALAQDRLARGEGAPPPSSTASWSASSPSRSSRSSRFLGDDLAGLFQRDRRRRCRRLIGPLESTRASGAAAPPGGRCAAAPTDTRCTPTRKEEETMTRLRDERGASVVEFALLLPLLSCSCSASPSSAAPSRCRARSRPPPARACGSWRCRTTRRPPAPPSASPHPLDPGITDAQITITPGHLPGPAPAAPRSAHHRLPPAPHDRLLRRVVDLTGTGVMRCGG